MKMRWSYFGIASAIVAGGLLIGVFFAPKSIAEMCKTGLAVELVALVLVARESLSLRG